MTTANYTVEDSGNGTTITLNCTKDADIWESIPEDHGGHIPHFDSARKGVLIVGKMPEYSRKRILIQFENVPDEYVRRHIEWAKMYLYYSYAHKASWQKKVEAPSIGRHLQVHQLLKNWDEIEVTSKYRSNESGWNEPFVALDDSDAALAWLDRVTVYPQRPPGYVEFDVTEAVRNWCTGQENHGVLLWATNEDVNGRELRFCGSRYDEEPDMEPKLIVQCRN